MSSPVILTSSAAVLLRARRSLCSHLVTPEADEPVNRFAELGMALVAKYDRSRPIWPSSPASGWTHGVDRLSTRPNGRPLVIGGGVGATRPPLTMYPFFLDSHGPYGTDARIHMNFISHVGRVLCRDHSCDTQVGYGTLTVGTAATSARAR